MAITRQYGDVVSQGRAAFAAGKGENQKFLKGLELQVQQLNQSQQRIDLSIEEAVQRERMQQRQIGFADVSQRRGLTQADTARRENLANANRQLQYSTTNVNRRQIVSNEYQNQRLGYSEAQNNARTSASLTVSRMNQLSQIQGQNQRQAQSLMANERMALFNAGDARQRMILGGQIQGAQNRQQAYLRNEIGVAQSQRQLENQREYLGYESLGERDAAQTISQDSPTMQAHQQQVQGLMKNFDYAPGVKDRLDGLMVQQERLREMNGTGNYDPRTLETAYNRVQRQIREILPDQPKLSVEDQDNRDSYRSLDGEKITRDANGNLSSRALPPISPGQRDRMILHNESTVAQDRATKRTNSIQKTQQAEIAHFDGLVNKQIDYIVKQQDKPPEGRTTYELAKPKKVLSGVEIRQKAMKNVETLYGTPNPRVQHAEDNSRRVMEDAYSDLDLMVMRHEGDQQVAGAVEVVQEALRKKGSINDKWASNELDAWAYIREVAMYEKYGQELPEGVIAQ